MRSSQSAGQQAQSLRFDTAENHEIAVHLTAEKIISSVLFAKERANANQVSVQGLHRAKCGISARPLEPLKNG